MESAVRSGADKIYAVDISFVSGGSPVEPLKPIRVRMISDAIADIRNASVVHISDEGDAVEVDQVPGPMPVDQIQFDADSFSVYAIVETDKTPPAVETVADLAELSQAAAAGEPLYLSVDRGSGAEYVSNTLNNNNAFIIYPSIEEASEWFVEPVSGQTGRYYIYTYIGGVKRYITRSGNNASLVTSGQVSFEASEASDGSFRFKVAGETRWFNYSKGGVGMRFWDKYADVMTNNPENSIITLTKASSLSVYDDYYGLDGKTYGISFQNGISADAMMADSGGQISAQNMLIRTNVLTNDGVLLVAQNSDITEWTFEAVENNVYKIKTTVGGSVKYLRFDGSAVTLADEDEASLIIVNAGTGGSAGKWCFSVGGYSLSCGSGTFGAVNGSGANTWMNLVEKTSLTEEDFVSYSARKISVSDEGLGTAEKANVIIYTRLWNDTKKQYEFYAVDYNGSLIPLYDSGDLVIWVGNQVNSALWQFTEYTGADGRPNYYYELENTAHRGNYLAPQSDGIISGSTVGINLNGRREGLDYTTVVAWDEAAYAYSGLKVNTDTMKVETCPFEEAQDFYFASIVPSVTQADPTATVATVDSDQYGVSIKMVDFNNKVVNNRDSVQNPFFGAHAYNQTKQDSGLLSTNLINGYPVTTAHTGNEGHSLAELFTGMTPANHLFIQSVYNESGYFEYDSTQNFAHLNEDGTFTVYDQIGAIGKNTGPTRAHGQFMPYNDISPEVGYAYDDAGNLITNRYDVSGNELPDTDPRKGEPLYLIPEDQNQSNALPGKPDKADYFFGMELTAGFTQTVSGLDDWGHDIIFEFTGDDDFWLYVDNELVLDLGGIHSAMPGSVNFRTGEVRINNTNTTLYEIFRKHYIERGMSEAEIDAKLDAVFDEKTVDGASVRVFKDYTNHTMKMFYMERGAGASNLKMRFNLASVKPGTVELSKKLSGANSSSNKLMQYPYQIWYKNQKYQTDETGAYVRDIEGNLIPDGYDEPVLMRQGSTPSAKSKVVYKGTNTLIPYRDTLLIDGVEYQNVFMLKPGDTAVIMFPEDDFVYQIIECGVNTEVYQNIYVNNESITANGQLYNNTDTGSDPVGSSRRDFGVGYATSKERPRAEYNNEVAPGVMRTLEIKKDVYGTDGQPLTDEERAALTAGFTFRLYLGNEFADVNDLPLADMYSYYVKDPDGNYCRWNSAAKGFDTIVPNIAAFEGNGGLGEYLAARTALEKAAIVFTTSMNGSISNIPAGYTVEVRDLVVGTQYMVEERDREIPKGFTRCEGDGYVRTDLSEGDYIYYTSGGVYDKHLLADDNTTTAEPVRDTIRSKTESPRIDIRNQEGWGLTAKKIWTDKDFMTHDPIYMAVYIKESDDSLSLYDGSVRMLENGDSEIYWFFPDLKVGEDTYAFDKFVIREVSLNVPDGEDPDDHISTDNNGKVTYDEYVSVVCIGDGETLAIGGTPAGGSHMEGFEYTVSYDAGDPTGHNELIRTDTITNSRPGIRIVKKDWNGAPLAGATFTLKYSGGTDVSAESYTSDSDGLVTIAYLNAGASYTLDEIRTPAGYVKMDSSVTITVSKDDEGRDVFGITDPAGCTVFTAAADTAMAELTVKNRAVQELKIIKVDSSNKEIRLEGVEFALYDQVSDNNGNLRKDYFPKPGYESLLTDSGGELPQIAMGLGAGTYYLEEIRAADGYKKLANDLCFTIGADGTVTIVNDGYKNWLTVSHPEQGVVSYEIAV
ncbi:MAG: fibro-slime domain-containing protein, partial [Clostridiales bacterium]|nr:fibro-slime domain-containing protein [Clostridiales bacterium]